MFEVDPDIRRARTPPAELYRDAGAFELQRRLFRRSWQLAPSLGGPEIGRLEPFVLLPGVVDAPLVLARGEDGVVRCLSNVCTHRANLVVEQAGCETALRCRYHGRRFGLDGRFVSMPEFEDAEEFPTRDDDLAEIACSTLGPLTFAAIEPHASFESMIAPLAERVAFAPLARLALESTRDYEVAAHWALYVENYLEGFHIPFVHAALNRVIDYSAYRTELFDWASLQVGVAAGDDPAFTLPPPHPDAADRVAAYYFFLFPSTMINVYPWGVSLNAVQPLARERTRVRFVKWVWDVSRLDAGAGSDLHRVELEDEAIVENVQRGVASPLYRRGRYSPRRELGVHHFHRLLARELASLD